MTRPIGRRDLLASAVAGAGLAGCFGSPFGQSDDATGSSGPPEPDADFPDAVGLETVASGLDMPLSVAFAPDADRRYVAERGGRVLVHEDDGLRDEPLLDLGDAVEVGGEKGLLGLALHPDFAENRRLYVRYSAPRRPGTPEEYSHAFVLAEFEADVDGRRARLDSERTVLEIPQPQANHNAGDVAFGPDGLLYVAVGDGGAGGDQGPGHVEDWYGAVDGGNGQNVTENLLGGLLRIDVDAGGGDADRTEDADSAESAAGAYGIPDDNPLVGEEGLDEYYAWGLRNPWRLSFDGDRLLVADVGQDRYEEVNLVESGGNYGWNVREGRHCFEADECPDETPEDVRGGEPLVDPVIEYPQWGDPVGGVSVIGGHVYRGSALPSLEGTYLFGDLQPRDRLFVAVPSDESDEGLWPAGAVEVADGLERLLSFGRDDEGEVYVLGTGPDGEGLYRIVPEE